MQCCWALLVILAAGAYAQGIPSGSFQERVVVDRLDERHALLHVELVQAGVAGPHQILFPLPIARLAAALPATWVHLELTRGLWDTERWGLPSHGMEVHPPGAVLRVVWPGGQHQHQTHWAALTHRLSGLLCASLNLLADPAAAPQRLWPLQQQHLQSDCARNETAAHSAGACHTRAGTIDSTDSGGTQHEALLPREATCSENLTPWTKLLPCGGAAGAAALLRDRRLVLGGVWYSLGLQLTVQHPHATCATCQPHLQLKLTFSAVLPFAMPVVPDPAPRLSILLPHWATTQACTGAAQSWLTLAAAGKALGPALPLVTTQQWFNTSSLTLPDHITSEHAPGTGKGAQQPNPIAPGLQLETHLHGSGLSQGLLALQIHQVHAQRVAHSWVQGWALSEEDHPPASLCTHPLSDQTRGSQAGQSSQSRKVATHDPGSAPGGGLACVELTIPWSMRVWTHTLRMAVDGKEVDVDSLLVGQHTRPAVDRGHPLGMVLCLRLPPTAHTVSISLRVSRAFLLLVEHPPDAHRGADVPAPRLHYCHQSGSETADLSRRVHATDSTDTVCSMQQVLGKGLLLQMPTPDVAMPYNVICLTSTVLAVYFGACFAALVSGPGDSPLEKQNRKALLARVVAVAVALRSKIWA